MMELLLMFVAGVFTGVALVHSTLIGPPKLPAEQTRAGVAVVLFAIAVGVAATAFVVGLLN